MLHGACATALKSGLHCMVVNALIHLAQASDPALRLLSRSPSSCAHNGDPEHETGQQQISQQHQVCPALCFWMVHTARALITLQTSTADICWGAFTIPKYNGGLRHAHSAQKTAMKVC